MKYFTFLFTLVYLNAFSQSDAVRPKEFNIDKKVAIACEKVKIDPETYKIINVRLFLFYNFWGNNTLETWNMAEGALKQKVDQNWKKIIPSTVAIRRRTAFVYSLIFC